MLRCGGVFQGVPQLVAPPGQVTLSLDAKPAIPSTRTMRARTIKGTWSAAQLLCSCGGFGALGCGLALSRAGSVPGPPCPAVAIASPAVVFPTMMTRHRTSPVKPRAAWALRGDVPRQGPVCEWAGTGCSDSTQAGEAPKGGAASEGRSRWIRSASPGPTRLTRRCRRINVWTRSKVQRRSSNPCAAGPYRTPPPARRTGRR